MNDEEDFASDTSDEDYMPTADGEALSEEDGSGDEEAPLEDSSGIKPTQKRKRTKKKAVDDSRKRRGGIRLEDEADEDDKPEVEDNYNQEMMKHIEVEKHEKKQEAEKKKSDDLWADFMKDVEPSKPKPRPSSGLGSLSSVAKPATETATVAKSVSSSNAKAPTTASSDTRAGKITITKEYDFAGEVVQVTKEVDANSKEAKAELKKQDEPVAPKPTAGPSLAALKRPGGGGLGSVLGKIGKKQKMGTLEKSQLDWNSFKRKEGIDEELQIHNRGKQSYIERQAFLERTDYRQFEIERDIRLSNSKR